MLCTLLAMNLTNTELHRIYDSEEDSSLHLYGFIKLYAVQYIHVCLIKICISERK